jgi:hypothetical protein
MWILPKQLHTSHCVLDTEGSTSDLNDACQLCEQSLLARSKPTQSRTWLRKWKRDKWIQHLFGRILKPSRGIAFQKAFQSYQGVFPANLFPLLETAKAMKTQDTSSHT